MREEKEQELDRAPMEYERQMFAEKDDDCVVEDKQFFEEETEEQMEHLGGSQK